MSATAPKEVWDEAMCKAGYASTQELADAVGVTEKSLQRWINGASHPRHRQDVDALADLLYIDAEILFSGWVPYQLRVKDEKNMSPLRVAMLRAGHETINDFAIAAGVPITTVKGWLNGCTPPNDDLVCRVAGLLNVAPTDIWPNWQPSSTLKQKIFEAGYPTVTAFVKETGIADISTVDNWIQCGSIPRSDDMVHRVAELLHADPNELWPDWSPRAEKKKRASTYIESYAPRADHGVTQTRNTPETIAPGMVDMRRNAQVYVGQRFEMIRPTKDGTMRKTGTVVECAPCWFRIQYDAGWSECFHYQCRIDQTEHKYFRTPMKKQKKEA